MMHALEVAQYLSGPHLPHEGRAVDDAKFLAKALLDCHAQLVKARAVVEAAKKFIGETRNDLGSVRDEMEAADQLAAAIDEHRAAQTASGKAGG